MRLETDGHFGLRVITSPRRERAGDVLGTWRFSGDPAVDQQVLDGLRGVLGRILQESAEGEPAHLKLVTPDHLPTTCVVIDAAPEVVWERTAWVLQAATRHPPMIRRFTFLGQAWGVWRDLRVPEDTSRGFYVAGISDARRLVVRLFRKGLDGPSGGSFTRTRCSADSHEVSVNIDGFPYEVEGLEMVKSEPAMTILDLPPSPFVAWDHPTAWAGLEKLFAERGPEPVHYAEVRTPRPIGTLVPTADVIEVLLRLGRAGYAPILLDNPAPPGASPDEDLNHEPLGR